MKIALVGTGMIAHEVLGVFEKYFKSKIEVVSVYSRFRTVKKAKKLAQEYQIPAVFTIYDEMMAQEDIDFVYVANANSVHYEYARMALESGHNVIVEKPICPTMQETQDLVQLALRNHLFLFEAVSLLHLPNMKKVGELLPELGKIKIVNCNYSQYSSRYDRYLQHDVAPAFDPHCAGGALLDLNIYNVNFVVGLFGMPVGAQYYPNKGFNGVDTSGMLALRYPTFVATCIGAKDCAGPSHCTIQGEKGWLQIEGAPNELKEIKICTGGKIRTYALNVYKHRLVHEFEEFLEIYEEQNFEKMKSYLDISLNVMKTLNMTRG